MHRAPTPPSTLPPLKKRAMNPFDTEEVVISKFQKLSQTFLEFLLNLQMKYETIGDDDKEPDSQRQIHPYQISAVLKTHEKILQDKSERISKNVSEGFRPIKPVIIVAPTGSGKSGMIALLPYILSSSKVLVLTPSKDLGDQLAVTLGSNKKKPSFYEVSGLCTDQKKLNQWLETVTVVKESKDILQGRLGNLVIVNAQKFGGRAKTTLSQKVIREKLLYGDETVIEDVYAFFEQFDTLLVDEAHHYPAQTWVDIIEAFSRPASGLEKKIVFLTATPYRQVKGKMVPILGEMQKDRIALTITPEDVKGTTTRPCEFIEDGAAVTPENVTPDIVGILAHQESHEPRFTPQCMMIMRTKNEVKKWAQEMCELTGDQNFAVSLTADDPPENLDNFNNGVCQVGITCGLLKEGYDNQKVTLCVILRNIGSKVLFTQFTGRCMRLVRFSPGHMIAKQGIDKTTAIILSYKKYNQAKMWKSRDKLATTDPSDEDDEEDEFESSDDSDDEDRVSSLDKNGDIGMDVDMDGTEDEDDSMESEDEGESQEEDDDAWIPEFLTWAKSKLSANVENVNGID